MARIFIVLFFAAECINLSAQPKQLPLWGDHLDVYASEDWLVKPVVSRAEVYLSQDKKNLVLFNGLVKRVFRITPNVACIDYTNMTNGQQLLRAIKPEAQIILDGKIYDIGGLKGQQEKAYLLPQWVDGFEVGENDFQFIDYKVTELSPFVNWKPNTWHPNSHRSKKSKQYHRK